MVVRRRASLALAIGLWLALAPAGHAAVAPRLLVIVVIDQLRADHLDTFSHRWKDGLRTLLDAGAYFPRAEYPYLNTVTCAGHTTIGTGAYPRTHGIILNGWWHREAKAFQNCMDDPANPHIGYGGTARGGSSPKRLLIPTLADELRAQRPGSRVATVGNKPRSAIPLAGHAGVVSWFEENAGVFVTSPAFAGARVPEVEAFTNSNPVGADNGRMWTLRAPEASYRHPDLGIGERPVAGWTAVFPHPVSGRNGTDRQFSERWQKSPFADAYLGRFAGMLVDRLQLGQRETTDFLGVALSTLDISGHDFGPRSREAEDLLMGIDEVVGGLIRELDARVGRGQYVLALTGDHGVAPIPEQSGGGRLVIEDMQQVAENTLISAWGPPSSGQYVDAVATGHVYFADGVFARLAADPAAMARVRRALLAMPGVARVLRADRLSTAAGDPIVRAAALGYSPGRSGDLIVVPRPYWILELRADAEATEHGTPYVYDRRVPLFLFGAGIRGGRFAGSASPADIAPTLASLAGITLPRAEGRVLRETLR